MSKAHLMGAAALCALAATAASFSTPAIADTVRTKRSLARCTAYDQREGEASLDITIKNSCTMPIDCTISWQLVCAPESKKRKKVSSESTSFTISTDASQLTAASAASCGDDSWLIKGVNWRCEASKE